MAVALVLAFPSGGYFITWWGTASILMLGLLAISVVFLDSSWGGALGLAALGGLAGLAAWQGMSSAWAYEPAAAMNAMHQTILYAAAVALVLIGVRRTRDFTALLYAVLLATAAVAAYALASRLLPSLVSGDEQSRLSAPISYWNGLGVLLAFGAVLALGLAGHAGRSRWIGAACAALVPMFLLGLLLTFSRGAVVVAILGLVLLLALAPGRLETLAALTATGAVTAPLLWLANAEDKIAVISGPVPPHDEAGRRILLLLVAAMIASGLLTAGASALTNRVPGDRRRPIGVAVIACAIVALTALVMTRGPAEGPIGWTDQQFESFRAFDTQARNDAESVADRLAVAAGSGRWQNWSVAAAEFRSSPIVGTGAGDYRFFWEAERDVDLTVRNAHSLYLEVLGESGVIGLVLLLLPIAAILAACAISVRHRPPPAVARDLGIAIAAAAVVGMHLAGDWAWQLPAVTLPALVLGAGALKAAHLSRDEAGAGAGGASRWIIGLGAGVAALLVASTVASSVSLADAKRDAARSDLVGALETARAAQRLNPQDPSARLVEANILTDLGRFAEADRAFQEAVARSPRDWVIFTDWAAASLRRGDLPGARLALRRAIRLNPLEGRPRFLLARVSE